MLFASSIVQQISDKFENPVNKIMNPRSLLLLAVLMLLAFVAGRIIAMFFRKLTNFFSRQADKAKHLQAVERFRRAETILVISIALIRALLFVLALYLWWTLIHPNQQPTAIIGASALFAIIAGGVFGPVLRDLAAGSGMMAEHWFGVGDHIKIEPFSDMQGVVERMTLRSTRIRGINGEVVWVNNQSIAAVRVTPKGIRSIALEMFVSDLKKGEKLVADTELRLPMGKLMVASPLKIMTANEVAPDYWHLTAIAQTAPGREWLIEKYALDVIKELDSKLDKPVLLSEPISRNADSEAERRFVRAMQNAQKTKGKDGLTPPFIGSIKSHF